MNRCDFSAWELSRRARLHAALDAALPPAETYPARLHGAMRYASEGGKRLRALLVYGAGEALGLAPEQLDAPALAVELIHAFSLVHDDLPAMDNDDLRRGRATVHKAYDEGTAILVGDGLQTLAFEVLAASPQLGAEARSQMLLGLARASGSRGMTGGQQADLAAEGASLSLAELEQLHSHKTGALILACLELPLAAAPAASPDSRLALNRYGRALGLAYQIQDDVLDVTASTGTLGKTAGKDISSVKSTYVRLLGLEAAQARAETLFEEAQTALAGFDERANPLRDLTDRIRARRH
ncbi:geranyl transferase [Stagnimonas aquatica]|uniref:Geranyl transferase n=1 Tax=Stagnimonas aquatica TaxID=2689987 RepID=A0A3N0VDI6_9GAMM|nr:farnesyl diphosphate synthase [Stagnimonas aquatica]ROH90847.1 geranyl transferase [Stagnimonas aquatica]